VLENLRRTRLIGLATWVEEQDAYWADQRNVAKWEYLREKQAEAYKEFKARRG
jgi:hypothetical protein